MMMGCDFDGLLGWFGVGTGILSHLAFVALVVLAAIWMFKAMFPGKIPGGLDSVEILKRRYAKGEIDDNEYKRMKQDLS